MSSSSQPAEDALKSNSESDNQSLTQTAAVDSAALSVKNKLLRPYIRPKHTLWRLKTILSISFILLSTLPIYFATQYLYELRAADYRSVKTQQLYSYSQAMKASIRHSIIGVSEKADLIASRAQLRETFAAWQVTQAPEVLQVLERILGDVKGQVSGVRNIALYGQDGNLVVGLMPSTPPLFENWNISKSHIQVLPASQQKSLLVQYTTVLRLNAKNLGHLVVTFEAGFIESLLGGRDALGRTGEIMLGKLTGENTGVYISQGRYDQVNGFERAIDISNVSLPMTQALLGNEKAMHNTVDYSGNRVLAYTRYLPDFELGLVVKINESEIEQQVNTAFDGVYMMEFIVIGFAITIGILVSILIAAPIEGLNAHIRNQKKGQVPAPYYNFKGWYEVRSLTQDFNYMIEDIRELNEDLNKKVEERTKALEKANQALQEIAIRDSLTGLHNRRHIMEVMAHDLQQAKRYSIPFVVAMLDIDHFKSINDTLGHPAGDQVLVEVAKCLRDMARRSELVGRLGGEEFLVALMSTQDEPDNANPEYMLFFEKLRKNIAALPFVFDNKPLQVTVSIGVAVLENLDDTVEVLISHADQALYQAKTAGRNRTVLYTADS